MDSSQQHHTSEYSHWLVTIVSSYHSLVTNHTHISSPMVLEYAHRHLPLSKITQWIVGKYSSTMVSSSGNGITPRLREPQPRSRAAAQPRSRAAAPPLEEKLPWKGPKVSRTRATSTSRPAGAPRMPEDVWVHTLYIYIDIGYCKLSIKEWHEIRITQDNIFIYNI